MKQTITGLIQVIVVIICAISIVTAQQSRKCDFSKYKPLKIDHFLPSGFVERVAPKYPAAGKNMRVQGKVRIKILVDRRGTVVSTCAVEGHPLLKAVSEYAAYHSRFKPNFGYSRNSFKRKQFITDELTYNFVLP